MSYQFLALAFVAGIFSLTSAQAARVTVTVAGIRDSQGFIMAGLFDDAATFPQKFSQGARAAAQKSSVTLIFENVAPGRYAMSVFQDRNGNGKLDLGAFGVPQEPYGFSQDARAVMGPPSFDAAAFDVPAAGISLTVHLK